MNGVSTLSNTGSFALPCNFAKTKESMQVKVGHEYAVPNMRSRWFDFGAEITYEFESVNGCVEQAYLSVHNCDRDSGGNVVVSYKADSGFGTCLCVAKCLPGQDSSPATCGLGANHTASEDTSNIYTGTCSPAEMPYLYLPTILNCAPRPPAPDSCSLAPAPVLSQCPRLVVRHQARDTVPIVGSCSRKGRRHRDGHHDCYGRTENDRRLHVQEGLVVWWEPPRELLRTRRLGRDECGVVLR